MTPEHEWEADGAAGAGAGTGKDDTAVIQFYSKEKDDDPRFQGFGVIKEVSGYGCSWVIPGTWYARVDNVLFIFYSCRISGAHVKTKSDTPLHPLQQYTSPISRRRQGGTLKLS